MLLQSEVISYEKQIIHFQGIIELMATDINLRDSKETQLKHMVEDLIDILHGAGDISSASTYKKKLDKLEGIFSDPNAASE